MLVSHVLFHSNDVKSESKGKTHVPSLYEDAMCYNTCCDYTLMPSLLQPSSLRRWHVSVLVKEWLDRVLLPLPASVIVLMGLTVPSVLAAQSSARPRWHHDPRLERSLSVDGPSGYVKQFLKKAKDFDKCSKMSETQVRSEQQPGCAPAWKAYLRRAGSGDALDVSNDGSDGNANTAAKLLGAQRGDSATLIIVLPPSVMNHPSGQTVS